LLGSLKSTLTPPNRTPTVSRCLAKTHRRQAVHVKTRTTQQSDVLPGGRGWTARRFLEKSRNSNQTVQKQRENHAIIHGIVQLFRYNHKRQENNSPNLEFASNSN